MTMTFNEWFTGQVDDLSAADKYVAQKAWNAAQKAEREACVEIAEQWLDAKNPYAVQMSRAIASLIRQRGDA